MFVYIYTPKRKMRKTLSLYSLSSPLRHHHYIVIGREKFNYQFLIISSREIRNFLSITRVLHVIFVGTKLWFGFINFLLGALKTLLFSSWALPQEK